MKIPTILALTLLLDVPVIQAQNVPFDPAQASHLAGMWSDAPDILGLVCFGMCTQPTIDRLFELLDDPANDAISFMDLLQRVRRETIQPMWQERLTEFSRRDFPLPADTDPGFLECKPPGYARQIFTPHQNEVTVYPDRIEMHYGEWDALRTIWMDGRTPPADLDHSLLGFSVGHMEGDTLVVQTTHVSENRLFALHHSDQLQGEERYYVSEDGALLNMDTTFTDPVALSSPVTLKRIWGWAPTEEIYRQECQIPTDYIEYLESQEQ